MAAQVYIAVGSNLDPQRHIPLALAALRRRIEVVASSTFYWSEALARSGQPRFLNGVWCGHTNLSPRDLKFKVLRQVEHELGRRRSEDKHANRCIDLDLILYDDLVIDEPDLQLPDPEMLTRSFLFIPLFELAPQLEEHYLPPSTPSAPELSADEPFTHILRETITVEPQVDRP